MMRAKEALEIILKLDKEELISASIVDKSDVEADLGYEITDEQWQKFVDAYETDEILNDQRALAWMDALQIIRDEVEG